VASPVPKSANKTQKLAGAADSLRATLIACVSSVAESHKKGDRESALPPETTLVTLRNCVRDYTLVAKANGLLPEHVLLRIKEIVQAETSPPVDHDLLLRAIVAWSLGAYFDGT
jgi:hypothetical protein